MEKEQTSTVSSYQEKINHFISSIPNSRYIIEISKFCGYSEFILIYKDQTLIELYKIVSLHFVCNDIKGLYLTNNCQYKIPMSEHITLRDYIISNGNIIRPTYSLPEPVVYKFFLDDGHCCIDEVKLGDHV
jgi:hypothetical protein